jgi:hypothetical protein
MCLDPRLQLQDISDRPKEKVCEDKKMIDFERIKGGVNP